MSSELELYLNESSKVINALTEEFICIQIKKAEEIIVNTVKSNKPILVCGNGGSAADSLHIAAELKGRFQLERRPINAIALSGDISTITAIANDYSYEQIFSRQVIAYGGVGALLIAISTSGNSKNVVDAVCSAKRINMKVIALTGENGGLLKDKVDVCISVPSQSTPMIQQGHQVVYHYLCAMAEKAAVAGS
jgi:D-sedoheptulose 7-phosphate isomerase